MNSCCNGGCPPNQCKCYEPNPNYKYSKYDLIISLINTGLICYDSDSVRSIAYGKECLKSAIQYLEKYKKEENK